LVPPDAAPSLRDFRTARRVVAMRNMLSARRLSRSFHGSEVVQEISFEIPEGKLFVLLGPNGAGKTTTVRMLLGLIAPTSGSAHVAGFDLGANAQANNSIRAACGLLTETPGFYDRMTAWENLQFFSRLYKIAESTRDVHLEGLLRSMNLFERRHDLVGTFSKGMKQKLAIIRAIFHDPKVIFFDEPTSGLDPEASLMVREMIARLKGEGRTIIVCTHNLDEAERLADLVGILRKRLLVFDSLANLQMGGRSSAVEVELATPPPALPGFRLLHSNAPHFTFEAPQPQGVPGLVSALVQLNAQVLAVRPRKRDLESIYLECIRGAGEPA
jgi:ABC-2 type transport system ATP-binding protein